MGRASGRIRRTTHIHLFVWSQHEITRYGKTAGVDFHQYL
jgi:hypothetical protein